MLRVAAVLAGSFWVPVNVIVTTPAEAVAVAPPDPLKPVRRAIVGELGTVKEEGNVTVIVSPGFRAPEELEVKPIVHVSVAPATSEEPVNVTELGAEADAGTALNVAPSPPPSTPSMSAREAKEKILAIRGRSCRRAAIE